MGKIRGLSWGWEGVQIKMDPSNFGEGPPQIPGSPPDQTWLGTLPCLPALPYDALLSSPN